LTSFEKFIDTLIDIQRYHK